MYIYMNFVKNIVYLSISLLLLLWWVSISKEYQYLSQDAAYTVGKVTGSHYGGSGSKYIDYEYLVKHEEVSCVYADQQGIPYFSSRTSYVKNANHFLVIYHKTYPQISVLLLSHPIPHHPFGIDIGAFVDTNSLHLSKWDVMGHFCNLYPQSCPFWKPPKTCFD